MGGGGKGQIVQQQALYLWMMMVVVMVMVMAVEEQWIAGSVIMLGRSLLVEWKKGGRRGWWSWCRCQREERWDVIPAMM